MTTACEDIPVWLTRTEAATRACVTERTIDRWLKDGMLIKYRQGKRVLIDQKELERKLGVKVWES